MKRRFAAGLSAVCASALLSAGAPAAARLIEENMHVPITVQSSRGTPVSRDIVLTVFHDDAIPGPYPLLILNHGRAVDAASRSALGRARYSVASLWFAHRGFMVAVPTRIGYGVTGGADVEDSGSCGHKNYPPAYAASADLTEQVIATLRRRRDVAPDRTVIAGQSFGGTTAITLAARNPAGIQAFINFAGGGGGNPTDRPGRPCAPRSLERLFGSYGKTARGPTLWIYAENDRYFGAKYPRTWFDTFRAAGGSGEFHQLPPSGEDGHRLFTDAPEAWQPVVLQFLNANGFAIKK